MDRESKYKETNAPRSSIRARIVIGAALAVLLSLLTVLYFYFSTHFLLKKAIGNDLNRISLLVQEHISTDLEGVMDHTRQIAGINGLRVVMELDLPAQAKNILEELVSNSNFHGLWLLRKNGEKMAHAARGNASSSPLNHEEVSPKFLSWQGRLSVAIRYPVISDKRVVGHLISLMPFPRQSLMDGFPGEKEIGMAFWIEDQLTACSSWLRSTDIIKDYQWPGNTEWSLIPGFTSPDYFTHNFNLLGASNGVHGKLVYTLEEIKKPLNTFFLVFLLGWIVFLGIFLFLTRDVLIKVVRPVLQLASFSNQIRHTGLPPLGNTFSRLLRRNDEVGTLTRAYKEMVQSLARSKAKAEEANSLKSEFLSKVSHELRTPMNAILGMSQLLEKTELKKNQKKYIDLIHSSVESLLVIINDILDVSKIEAGRLEVVKDSTDLKKMLEELAYIFTAVARKNRLDFECIIEPQIPNFVRTDGVRLRQILTNLLNNAVKFTHEGEVGLRVTKVPVEFEKEPEESRVAVRFEVFDTGIGIPKDKKSSIFQPFVQADGTLTRQFEGTGLGLTIADKLVKLLGGTGIEVESVVGEGSSFIFSLVLETVPEHAIKEPEPKEADLSGQNGIVDLRVLVVEDNALNQNLIEEVLETMGIKQIRILENGQKAVDAVLKDPEAFDVVLMDIQMPEMDGIQATKLIRSKGINIPIVALTGLAMVHDSDKCLQAGMDYYLSKPYKFKDLQSIFLDLSGKGSF